jgi:hypothetical protein
MSFVKHVSAIAFAFVAVACAKFEINKPKGDVAITPKPFIFKNLTIESATSTMLGAATDDSSRIDFKIADEFNAIEGSSTIAGTGADRIVKDDGAGNTYSIEPKCWMQNCAYFAIMVTRVNSTGRKQLVYTFYAATRGQKANVTAIYTDTNYSDVTAAIAAINVMP